MVPVELDTPFDAAQATSATATKRLTWAQTEGSPLPLGVTWIEREQAFNFAVYSEHAESVTLLLYSASDLVNPLIAFPLDFLRNKSGRICTAECPPAKLPRPAIMHIQYRDQPGLNFSASIRKRFSSTHMPNVFSFPPGFDRELA